MALQGPFVVVADSPATDVVEALHAAGAFPIIETNWADAAAAIASVEPEAVVLAEACSSLKNELTWTTIAASPARSAFPWSTKVAEVMFVLNNPSSTRFL